MAGVSIMVPRVKGEERERSYEFLCCLFPGSFLGLKGCRESMGQKDVSQRSGRSEVAGLAAGRARNGASVTQLQGECERWVEWR